MLWAKKMEQCQASMARQLTPFLLKRLPDSNPGDVAQDLTRTAIKVDMSRSASRLRRRLYAQWGKWDLCEGELYRLAEKGLEVRPDLFRKDPLEVGDLHVDIFRIISVVKMLGLGKSARLTAPERVQGVLTVLHAIMDCTRAAVPRPALVTVGVLMAFHAVEANREVPKASVQSVVDRHLPLWSLAAVTPEELEKEVTLLRAHGALRPSAGETHWRLGERLSYPW